MWHRSTPAAGRNVGAVTGEEPAGLGPATIEWRRHPADLARLVVAGGVLALLLGLAAWQPDALTTVSEDLVRLLTGLPGPVRNVLGGLAQLAVFALPLAAVGWALAGRALRPIVLTAACAVAAALATGALTEWLNRVAPPEETAYANSDSWLFGAQFPSAAYVAALAAGVTVLSPLLNRSWRRVAWAGVFVAGLLRLLTTAVVPVNVGVAVALGVTTASAVLLAAGAPWRRTDPARVAAALAGAGVDVDGVTPLDGGSRPSFAARVVATGVPLHVAWIGRDERDADLLYRGWRAIRVKGVDDELAGVGARQQARQEALALLLAAEAGTRVPAVVTVGETEEGDGVLAVTAVDGRRLADLDGEEVGDDLLTAVWAEVARLHGHRIAHRRLGLEQVLVTRDGPVVLGLRAAQLSASDLQLGLDVADLLVATADRVGPERAVAAAGRSLSHDELAAVLPLVQPLALNPDNRRRAKEDKGLLEAVRGELQAVTGVDEVELFPLERIGIQQVVSVFGTVFLSLVLLAFVSNWSDISAALREADWSRLPLLLVLAALPYPAGALSLMGSVVRPVPLGRTTVIMFGQSFLNRFTPMNAGGMAMRVRYLQKGGTDVAVAAAAIGSTSLASGIAQGVMIAVFVLWAGSSVSGDLSLPNLDAVLPIALGIAFVLGVLMLVPSLRRLIGHWLQPLRERLGPEAKELVRRPDKLGLLFGGAFLSKLFTISAFIVSCRALGITVGTAELGARYLLGNTVGSAVPTPGGVGGVEAALIAVLVGAGVDQATAAAAVVVFRVATYWLPVIPGYGCLRLSRSMDLV